MVLTELGSRISEALSKFSKSRNVNKEIIDELVKEVVLALNKADVSADIIRSLRKDITAAIDLSSIPPDANKHNYVQQILIKKLIALLDPKTKQRPFTHNKSNVVMFVGLQGSGKTTTIAKYGLYYKRRGWRVGLVCADTFRAGAFDQLKQNAERVAIPFYGSYEEKDPVKIASEGVEHFKRAGVEIIIVDTSGRHKQSEALFNEMKEVEAAVRPTETVFVLDATIGQAAKEQSEAFKAAVPVGSIVVTKLDGNAKGGGAISAIAATGAPIVFVCTGEKFDDIEVFDAESFVGRLLGYGDMKGLLKEIKRNVNQEEQVEILNRALKGGFCLKDFRTQIENISKLGPISKTIQSIPGMQKMMDDAGEAIDEGLFKKWLIIMDSMKMSELYDVKQLEVKGRKEKIARGSGTSVQDVEFLIRSCEQMSKMFAMLSGGQGGMEKMVENAKKTQKKRRGYGNSIPNLALANQAKRQMDSMSGLAKFRGMNMMELLRNPGMMREMQAKMEAEMEKDPELFSRMMSGFK